MCHCERSEAIQCAPEGVPIKKAELAANAALFVWRASRALDCFAIGERSDAVLRTAMARNDSRVTRVEVPRPRGLLAVRRPTNLRAANKTKTRPIGLT